MIVIVAVLVGVPLIVAALVSGDDIVDVIDTVDDRERAEPVQTGYMGAPEPGYKGGNPNRVRGWHP